MLMTTEIQTALIIAHNLKSSWAEHQHGSEYCRHGTYVGHWAGPDYLCGLCESPEPVTAYELALAEARELVAGVEEAVLAAHVLHERGYIDRSTLRTVIREEMDRLPRDNRPKRKGFLP